jgi:hypothetical protein
VNTFVIQAVPPSSFGVFSVAFQILFAVIDRSVVLARDVEDLFRSRAFEYLIHRVELGGFGLMAEVAGMNDEFRLIFQAIDSVYGGLKGGGYIGIRRLVETHVAVTDLNEMQIAAGLLIGTSTVLALSEYGGFGNASRRDRPHDSRAGPSHAFEESSAIHAVLMFGIVKTVVIARRAFGRHRFALLWVLA